ncbi:MAG: hypothetical protein MUF81_05230 [Verrucomicrobia bacterium]|jgi:hypothetical protein|nr:hypothetical protein [Verrucomicrobiota bacterium]
MEESMLNRTALLTAGPKTWLKADAGHGAGLVNCWADQSSNNLSPIS